MSRKHPKPKPKVAPPVPGPLPAAPAPSVPAPAPEAGVRVYWLGRARKFAAQGKEDRVHEALARVFPPDPLGDERLIWALAHCPAIALASLRAARELSAPHILMALASTALQWSEDLASALLTLAGLPESFLREARAVRAASALLAAGDDTAAMASLRTLGRESPFRDVARFLRGLGAYYRGASDEAGLALRPLLSVTAFAGAAATLLARCGHADVPASPDHLLAPDEAALVAPVVEAARARHPSQLMAALSAAVPAVGAALRRLLVRDAAAALSAMGVEPESILLRLRRAVPSVSEIASPTLLFALVLEQAGHRGTAGDLLLESVRTRQGSANVRAAVAHRGALDLMESLGRPRMRCPDCGRFHGDGDDADDVLMDAMEAFELAVECSPDDAGLWVDYLHAAERLHDRRERDRILERFVKRFPEHPEALLEAARAATARGSFDKAVGYARRAATLLPLDRGANDLILHALLGKARKKARAGQKQAALDVLAEASTIASASATVRQRIAAARSAVEADGRFAASDPPSETPWVWQLLILEETREVQAAGTTRRRAPPFLMPSPDALPAPGVDELRTAMRLGRDIEDRAPELTGTVRTIVGAALVRGLAALTELADVREALRWGLGGKPGLQLLIRAQSLAPDEPIYIFQRYELAVNLGRPAAEFVAGETDLDRASALLRQQHQEHLLPHVHAARKAMRAHLARLARGTRPARTSTPR